MQQEFRILIMNIELDHIFPIPLKDKVFSRQSQIWNTQLFFVQGEFIKINAPSGTGKTTLVHFLYKLRDDYDGYIKIGNQLLTTFRQNELSTLRQHNLSITFQDLRLFPNLTARENIELKRVMQPIVHESDIIDSMANELGITGILEQKASLCSYGEQQRIAIIRSLMQPFNWLIMDEPFSHLDKANTAIAARLIEKECKSRSAGLIITDLDEDNNFNYTRTLQL